MGPDFLMVESPVAFPPDNATIVLQVDDSERRWTVRLPEGVPSGHNGVQISN